MIDKKKLLLLDTSSPSEVVVFTQENRDMFKEYFMVSFSDDPEEQVEEVFILKMYSKFRQSIV